jgi:hypothetical protein
VAINLTPIFKVKCDVGFALNLGSGEHFNQVLALYSRSIPRNPRYVGVSLTEFADRIQSHTVGQYP